MENQTNGSLILLNEQMPSNISYPKGEVTTWVDLGDKQKVVFIGYPRITATEIETFNNGEMRIGIQKRSSKVLIFSGQIFNPNNRKQTTIGVESTYHPNIDGLEGKQDYSKEKTWLQSPFSQSELTFIFFDTATGEVKGLRTIACNNKFSNKLVDMLIEINEETLTKEEFFIIGSNLQQRYTPEQLLELSTYEMKVVAR